jgi:hypothetical protein
MKLYRIEENHKAINSRLKLQYKAHSLFNSWSGINRPTEEQARIDGEEHQKILLTAYPNLVKLMDYYR